MKNLVKIKIKTNNKTNTLLRLNEMHILLKDINYFKDGFSFITNYTDIKKIKKYYFGELKIIEYLGLKKVKNNLKSHSLFITAIIFGLILFFFLSHIIIKVQVIHDNQKLRELVIQSLKENGVTPLSFKKSYKEYEEIIALIKEEYQDKIEWLEIEVKGMVVSVRLEERIIKDYLNSAKNCHIVATKSGVITSILTQKGVALVRINDFVKKDDILISGEIKLNEEIKNNVCANGEVYAEVWYQVNATIPLNYVVEERTGKMRYNFLFKNNQQETQILKSRIEDKQIENKKLFGTSSWGFFLQKEYEIKKYENTYTLEEAMVKAKEVIAQKLDLKLDEFEEKITEKVLKKSINNGNLYIEMFVSLKEQIGMQKEYTVEESGTNDEANNGNIE